MSNYDNWKTTPPEDHPWGEDERDPRDEHPYPDEPEADEDEGHRREAEEDAADRRQYGWGVSR